MRSRSWMAAWTTAIAVALTLTASVRANDDKQAVENKVKLDLRITGLTARGCVIEIKPAHPGCSFKPVKKTLDASNYRDPIAIDAKTTGADRDCSFAITIREPGQPAKTYRRGLCLEQPTSAKPHPSQTLRVYISAPNVAARDEPKSPPR